MHRYATLIDQEDIIVPTRCFSQVTSCFRAMITRSRHIDEHVEPYVNYPSDDEI